MTIFTVDVSSNQGNLTVREIKEAGYAGFMARCSIGHNADSEYARFRAEARAEELPFAPYHFLKSAAHTPLEMQAATLAQNIGDKTLRYMLDVESDINSTPSWSDAVKFTVISQGLGLRIGSLYLPRWYWQRIGQPEIHTPLVASAYGENPAGPVNAIYPGDEFWPDAYGGATPFLWQFGSRDRLLGAPHDNDAMNVDVNAYRGAVLPGSIFHHWVPPNIGEFIMDQEARNAFRLLRLGDVDDNGDPIPPDKNTHPDNLHQIKLGQASIAQRLDAIEAKLGITNP